jgi:hypothetical protein
LASRAKSKRLIWVVLPVLVVLGSGIGLLRPWGVIGTAVPSARYAAATASVPAEGKAYLFGGRYEGLFGTAYGNDLWVFDYGRTKWSRVRTRSRPPARGNANMAYDPDRHQLVLTADAPSPRVNAAMAYDPAHDAVLLFGGLEEDMTDVRDTWILGVTGSGYNWVRIAP